MADISEIPYSSRPGGDAPPARRRTATGTWATGAAVAFAAAVGGSALLGMLAGLAWTALAPHPLLITTGGGGADVVNPETSAFIVADGWFILLSVAGGAICGLLGWVLSVRRHGVVTVLGLLAGGVAAALLARWAGHRSGQAAFARELAASRPGTLLRSPVTLGAHGALAFWPLAVGLVVGGIEAARLMRDRRRAAARPAHALAPAEGVLPNQADGW